MSLVALQRLLLIPICSLLILVPSRALAGESDPKCRISNSPQYVSAASATTELTPADVRTTSPPPINFGTDRSIMPIAPYRFNVDGQIPALETISWDSALVDGNNAFPEDRFGVTFSERLGRLQVALCLDGENVPPGAYTGSLTIAGGSLKPTQLPLTVNLRDGGVVTIVFGLIVVSLAAIFFKWWTVKVADPTQTNSPNLGEFFKWLRQQYVSVLIAVIGAAGGILVLRYYKAEAFKPTDRPALWGAAFTAVTTAALLTNAVGKAVTTSGDPGVQKAVRAAKAR